MLQMQHCHNPLIDLKILVPTNMPKILFKYIQNYSSRKILKCPSIIVRNKILNKLRSFDKYFSLSKQGADQVDCF